MTSLAHSRLLEILNFDPETGVFRCRKNYPKRKAGEVSGGLKRTGYWGLRIDETDYLAHRVAWFYVFGVWPQRLDHKDGDKLNNRIANLREATVSQNAANKCLASNNTSGFKGIRTRVNAAGAVRWQAKIEIQQSGRRKSLTIGTFDTPELASDAYRKAAEKHFGEFARVA